MARDGSGNYSRVEGPYVNGVVADADEVNAELDDIAQALSDSINRAGTKAMAADLAMGGYKVSGLAAATVNGDAVRYEQLAGLPYYQPLDATTTALAALSWSSGNALVQFTAADTVSLTLTPSVTDLTLSGVLKLADGAAGAGTLSGFFTNDTNTGFYLVGADQFGIVTGGTLRVNFTTTQMFSTILIRGPDGSAATPSLSFNADPDNGFYRIGTNNWAGAVGGAKFVDYSTTLVDFSLPVRARTPTSAETSGTLTSASANKVIAASGGITIDGNVFTAGDSFMIYAGASSRTLTQGSTGSPTQRLHGSSTTGNLTLAARGVAVVYVISATEWVCSGDVS